MILLSLVNVQDRAANSKSLARTVADHAPDNSMQDHPHSSVRQNLGIELQCLVVAHLISRWRDPHGDPKV